MSTIRLRRSIGSSRQANVTDCGDRMTATSVRYDRENFIRAVKSIFSPLISIVPVTVQEFRREIYLLSFIAVQIVEYGLLSYGERLDFNLAICLSANLFIGALFFAKDRSDHPQGTLLTKAACLDVTDSKTISLDRTALKKARNIDEQSQSWAELMARISHEIRTPLNAVIGFSDLMEREIFGPIGNPRYRDYIAHIKDSGDALLKSAEDTLALSSLLATSTADHRLQYSSLWAITDDAWHFVEPLADRRSIAVDFVISKTQDVAGDRRALRQALSNLMMEAVERATPHSRIEVRSETHNDNVIWQITVATCEPLRDRMPSTALCVARALLELQGTSLVTDGHGNACYWQAATVLNLAVQADFFR